MPKATFFNLDPAKRYRFIDAALDEFGRQPFDRASLTALTKRLGIAKGSIYQYFEDKVDLYAWLIAEAGRRKIAHVQASVPTDGDLFSRLTGAYAAGLRFLLADPRWASVVLQLDQPSTEVRIEALRTQGREAGVAWIRDRLVEGQAEGVVRMDLDLDLTSRLVHATLSHGLMAAFLDRAGVSVDTLLADPDAWAGAGSDVFLAVVEETLGFLRRALEP